MKTQVFQLMNKRSIVVLHSTDHKHRKCYLWITTKLKQNDMKYTCYNHRG